MINGLLGRLFKAFSVVAYFQRYVFYAAFNTYIHTRRAGMFNHIVEAFLRYAVQNDLYFVGYGRSVIALRRKGMLDVFILRHMAEQFLHGVGQRNRFQIGRPQTDHDVFYALNTVFNLHVQIRNIF